ncbi:MAG: M55 family metallopeptidase [Pseudohongiellaceae bacterium]
MKNLKRLHLSIYSVLLLLVLLPLDSYAQDSLKVYISADMEGIAGASSSSQVSSNGIEYEKFRRIMTLEVNAAIDGAFAAGATEVLVADSHGNAQNIDVELLDSRVQLVRSWPRSEGMVHGIDETFDAVVLVGYHAREGDYGILAHTFTGSVGLTLNGEPTSEATFAAAIAGHFGVPVVFLSGDQIITSDAQRQFGSIEVAVVKESFGFNAAKMLHPEEARRLIRVGVERGVRQRDDIQPFVMESPVSLELRWEDPAMAEIVSLINGSERIDGMTSRFTGDDMIEVVNFFEVVHHIRLPQ